MENYNSIVKDCNLVFVYGSLKQGRHNHPVLHDESGVAHPYDDFLWMTDDKTIMINNYGSFPGLMYPEAAEPFKDASLVHPCVGELYIVDEYVMRNLDRLEGHPTFYTRSKMKVSRMSKEDGEVESLEVWGYYQNNLIDSRGNINTPLANIEEFSDFGLVYNW